MCFGGKPALRTVLATEWSFLVARASLSVSQLWAGLVVLLHQTLLGRAGLDGSGHPSVPSLRSAQSPSGRQRHFQAFLGWVSGIRFKHARLGCHSSAFLLI